MTPMELRKQKQQLAVSASASAPVPRQRSRRYKIKVGGRSIAIISSLAALLLVFLLLFPAGVVAFCGANARRNNNNIVSMPVPWMVGNSGGRMVVLRSSGIIVSSISRTRMMMISPSHPTCFFFSPTAEILQQVRTSRGSSCQCRPGSSSRSSSSSISRRPRRRCATSSIAAAKNGDDEAEETPTTPPQSSSSSFYERLNSPKHILAPMVAQSDLPFRLMCEQLYGVDLSYTQMIHGTNFVESNGEIFRTNHLDVYDNTIVREVLMGERRRDDGNGRTSSSLCVTPSQVNALEGLSDGEIDEARERILDAISAASRSGGIAEASSSSESIIIPVKPTIVQIAAHDPDVAVKAAMMILERSGSMESSDASTAPVTAIDLNLGCPQSIARKGRYGSFLHDEHPELTYEVLAKLRSSLPREIGITAKMRLPPTPADAIAGKLGNRSSMNHPPQTIDERMRCLIDSGVDLITVHGRTRFENKVTVGPVDWNAVRRCVDTARAHSGDGNFPIFANGGIEFPEDVSRCLDETNASGVMSSESLLEQPGLFLPDEDGGGAASATARDLLERQLGYAEVYLDYATVIPPLPGSLGVRGGSFNVIRSHLFKFLHRYLEENPDLRSMMGDQDLTTIRQARGLVSDLRSRYDKVDEDQLRLKNSWSRDSSWYRRHRQRQESESIPSLSIDERKQLAKLRIKKMQEERMKRSIKSV